MVAKIRPIMSSTYITLGSRTASPFFSQVSFYLTSTMKMLADFNKGSFIAHVNVHPFPFLHLSCSPLIDAFFLQR